MGGGVNDTAILMGILFFLLGIVVVMPILQSSLRITDDYSVPDAHNPTEAYGVAQNDINSTVVSNSSWQSWNLISIIASLLIWFPAPIPLWFNLVFVVLRVTIIWLIVRLFRSGGG